MELGIGAGFVATALVLWHTIVDITQDIGQVNAYLGQFLLSVFIISLALPIVVTAIRRRIPDEVMVPHRYEPIDPIRRQLLIVLTGMPVLITLGWLTVDLSRMSVSELGGPLLVAVALITCLIPLGFVIVTGWRRFFVMTILVVASGAALAQLYGWFPQDSLFATSLFIWAFTGILFLATGLIQFLNFRRYYKLYRTTHESI